MKTVKINFSPPLSPTLHQFQLPQERLASHVLILKSWRWAEFSIINGGTVRNRPQKLNRRHGVSRGVPQAQ
jgi:hypothetical protein